MAPRGKKQRYCVPVAVLDAMDGKTKKPSAPARTSAATGTSSRPTGLVAAERQVVTRQGVARDRSPPPRRLRKASDREGVADEPVAKKQKDKAPAAIVPVASSTPRSVERTFLLLSSPTGNRATHGVIASLEGEKWLGDDSYLGWDKTLHDTYDPARYPNRCDAVHRFALSRVATQSPPLADRFMRRAMEAGPRSVSQTMVDTMNNQSLIDNLQLASIESSTTTSAINRAMEQLDLYTKDVAKLRRALEASATENQTLRTNADEAMKKVEAAEQKTKQAEEKVKRAQLTANQALDSEKKTLSQYTQVSNELQRTKQDLAMANVALNQIEVIQKKAADQDTALLALRKERENDAKKIEDLESALELVNDIGSNREGFVMMSSDTLLKEKKEASTLGYFMAYGNCLRTAHYQNGEGVLEALIEDFHDFIKISPPAPGSSLPLADLPGKGIELKGFDPSVTFFDPPTMDDDGDEDAPENAREEPGAGEEQIGALVDDPLAEQPLLDPPGTGDQPCAVSTRIGDQLVTTSTPAGDQVSGVAPIDASTSRVDGDGAPAS